MNDERSTVRARYEPYLTSWRRSSKKWRARYLSAAIVALCSTLITTTFVGDLHPLVMKMVGLAGAIALGIGGMLNMGARSDNARRAWQILDRAIHRHATDPEYTDKELCDEYATAQAAYSTVKFEDFSKERNSPAVSKKPET